MADLEKLFDVMPEAADEDSGLDFLIDEDLRVVAIPERGVVLGVEGDKDVNRIRFKADRMWRGNDMGQFDLRINYENAEGDLNFYTVVNKTVDGDTLTFEWLVAADAVRYKGDVHFIVVALITEDGVIKNAFHTTLGTAKCLQGLSVDEAAQQPAVQDFMATLLANVKQYMDAASESAAAAKESETAAATSAGNASTSETNAKASEEAAAQSAQQADTRATDAEAARNEATAQAEAANQSAAAAATSETNAEASRADAAHSAALANNRATQTKAALDAANESAAAAKESEDAAAQSAQNAADSAAQAESAKNEAAGSAEAAKASADKAEAAAATDSSLSIEGAPADAAATGRALNDKAGKDPVTGATAEEAGKAGLVPAPDAGAQGYFLRGDGSWVEVTIPEYAPATQTTPGLMSAADKKKLDALYPVGSIYMSTASTSPASLYGGTWAEIASERVLMGRSSTHAAASTVDAGLPNITGSFVADVYRDQHATSGAISAGSELTSRGENSGSDFKVHKFSLNASKSSAVYGKSTTVQPAAYYVYIWRRTK